MEREKAHAMKRAELCRLRREHGKALRLWRATRSPRYWKAMRDLTTEIVRLSGKALAT